MTKELEEEFDDEFNEDTLVSAHKEWTPQAIKDWIDSNFISRQELVERINLVAGTFPEHENSQCVLVEDILSLINPPISKE
jgi:hypothetical protein